MSIGHFSLSFLLLNLIIQSLFASSSDSLSFARTPDSVKSLIIEHMAYTLSWNSEFNVPNWVGYCLTRNEVETKVIERSNKFRIDPKVAGCPSSDEYKKSGYDRGHMAPSADMRWDSVAMRECFYMTNMCPQRHKLNAGIWKKYEDKVRELALRYDSIYICAGPIINKDVSKRKYIGSKCKVVVPTEFFKVLLVNNDGVWYAIAYIFPAEYEDEGLHIETIDFLEYMTGIDFFYNLPDDVETEVESCVKLEIFSEI